MQFIRKYHVFFFVSFIYFLSILVVSPWGNYSIGDDFYHLVQIKLFQTGDFYRNGQIGPSLILQAFIGLVWSTFFGLNFVSLKVLSMLFTLGTIFLLFRIFQILKVSEALSIIGILVLIFNPKFYYLSLTFNTEPFFTFLILLFFYNLLLFYESKSFKYLFFSTIFGGLSVLIRQNGVLLLVPLITTLFLNRNYLTSLKDKYIVSGNLLLFLLLSFIGIFWPRYFTEFRESSESALKLIDIWGIFGKLTILWKEIPYLSILLVPFAPFIFSKLKLKLRNLSILLGTLMGVFIFQINVFDIGNILYLEGLGARSYTALRISLFNNIFIKISLSIILGIVFIATLLYFSKNFKTVVSKNLNILILITSLFFLLSTVLPIVLYERYFLYFEFFIIFFVVLNLEVNRISLLTKVITAFLILFTTFYSMDFFYDNNIKWRIANDLAIERSMNKEKIFVQDNFLKLSYVLRKEDLKGTGPLKPEFPEYRCFVVNDIEERDNFLRKYLSLSNVILENIPFFSDKKPEGYGYFEGQVKKCSQCDILKKEYYFSPIYEVLGISKYVKAYCIK